MAIRTAPIPDFSVLRVWSGYERDEQQIQDPWQLGKAHISSGLKQATGLQDLLWPKGEGPKEVLKGARALKVASQATMDWEQPTPRGWVRAEVVRAEA